MVVLLSSPGFPRLGDGSFGRRIDGAERLRRDPSMLEIAMDFLHKLYDLLRHLGDDTRWQAMIAYLGAYKLYAVLFLIVFAETGLVVTPFLPGDTLVFALGAVAARGVGINLPVVTLLLIVAAVLGDAVNYWIGYRIGPKVFAGESSRLLNRKHLLRAQAFYDKYGGKTIILARFVPVVRTFAPFVAGVGRMNYFRFLLFNIIGGVAWVLLCVTAGYKFGAITFVKQHFELVIVAIVVLSVVPMAIEYLRARRQKAPATKDPATNAPAGFPVVQSETAVKAVSPSADLPPLFATATPRDHK